MLYSVNKFLEVLENEANFNKIFIYSDVPLLNSVKSIVSLFLSNSFVSNSDSLRPSTSYVRPPENPSSSNFLGSLLHVMNICNDLINMLECAANNEFPSNVLKIYTEIPVEFAIWKHSNQVFWARLVHAFYERINLKHYPSVSPEDFEEPEDHDDNLVVADWSVS